MFEYDVRQHLTFLPSGSASSSPSPAVSLMIGSSSSHDATIKKLENRLKDASNQIAAQKRKFDNMNANGGNRKGGKSKGKGNKGKGSGRTPPQFPGCSPTIGGKNVCFNFNNPGGCPMAKVGETCYRGIHLCIKCGGMHSYSLPCPSL